MHHHTHEASFVTLGFWCHNVLLKTWWVAGYSKPVRSGKSRVLRHQSLQPVEPEVGHDPTRTGLRTGNYRDYKAPRLARGFRRNVQYNTP